jgi:hypothetical protein
MATDSRIKVRKNRCTTAYACASQACVWVPCVWVPKEFQKAYCGGVCDRCFAKIPGNDGLKPWQTIAGMRANGELLQDAQAERAHRLQCTSRDQARLYIVNWIEGFYSGDRLSITADSERSLKAA